MLAALTNSCLSTCPKGRRRNRNRDEGEMFSSSVIGAGGLAVDKTLISFPHFTLNTNIHNNYKFFSPTPKKKTQKNSFTHSCSPHDSSSITSTTTTSPAPAPMIKKRTRYRKSYPGEDKGIVEEMRFVTMRLRNDKTTRGSDSKDTQSSSNGDGEEETWEPNMEGFLKYLVDSKLVFQTIEGIVDKSDDVSYVYFRNTGLERLQGLTNDLEWFREQDMVIPEPSAPGVSYVKYLEELAEKSAPSFLSNFYNIYFAHISGGQVITKQVSEKLLGWRELEFCRWDGDALELLKDIRENLNMLGEHWSREEKNKCLIETSKAFKFLGQIVRHIVFREVFRFNWL